MEAENPTRPADGEPKESTGHKPQIKRTFSLRALLANPWFGGIAAAASIVSLPLAIYMYVAGQARPRLTMYVHPVRTAVVKSGQTSALKVLFNNKETGPNVTAAQIAIWNDGKAPIRKENVLEDITLRLNPEYTILEASIRKLTRTVTGFQIVPAGTEPRLLALQWRILEPGDGAVIQIVYDGPASVGDFILRGTIEGQASLVTITPKNNKETGTSDSSPRAAVARAILLVLCSGASAWILGVIVSKLLERGRLAKALVGGFMGLGLMFVLGTFGYYILSALTSPYPPFGF
jgi:hypothetical protein